MAVVKVWKPLSGQIVNSFGQGKRTFDCLGISKLWLWQPCLKLMHVENN